MLRLAGPIAALLMLSACAIYPDDPVVYGTPAYPAPYPYPPGGPVVIAPSPPPAMIVETPPPMPVIGSVWVGGYWGWGGGRYSWRPGYWQPRPHGAWTPGYWRPYGGGWAYRQGYWHGGPGRPGRWR
jgi:hypothetical protein